MRPIERIELFRCNISTDFLKKRWKIDYEVEDFMNNENFFEEWNKYPDQRIGQCLINIGILKDDFKIWNDEDMNILYDSSTDLTGLLEWTSIYDADENPLKNPIKKPINKLTTPHILNILEYFKKNNQYLHPIYREAFKQELRKRNKNGITS